MEIEVLGAYGGESPDCRLTCLLINGTIALDAGCICRALPVERQCEVGTVILTHSHTDHTNGLPFFIDNVFGQRDAVALWGSDATLHVLRKHLFNSATWPDFSRLPNHIEPAIHFKEFGDEEPFEVEGLRFTPIPVNHVVPTHGFLIEDDEGGFLWSSDTGPTDRLWEVAAEAENLKAIAIDVSFDNDLDRVARDSGHLTPALLGKELQKLDGLSELPVYVHHMKPLRVEGIRREIAALGDARLDFLEQGKSYRF